MTLTRLARLREKLRARSLDALLVTSLPNIRYLTGFTGSNAMLVVLPRRAYFLTDQRYRQQSKEQVRGASRIVARTSLFDTLRDRQLLPRRKVGFESNHLSYADYRQLRRLLPGVALRPVQDLVEEIAIRKDESEIALLSLAIRITEQVFGTRPTSAASGGSRTGDRCRNYLSPPPPRGGGGCLCADRRQRSTRSTPARPPVKPEDA